MTVETARQSGHLSLTGTGALGSWRIRNCGDALKCVRGQGGRMKFKIYLALLAAGVVFAQSVDSAADPDKTGPRAGGLVPRYTLYEGPSHMLNGNGRGMFRLDTFTGQVWELVKSPFPGDKGPWLDIWQPTHEPGGGGQQMLIDAIRRDEAKRRDYPPQRTVPKSR